MGRALALLCVAVVWFEPRAAAAQDAPPAPEAAPPAPEAAPPPAEAPPPPAEAPRPPPDEAKPGDTGAPSPPDAVRPSQPASWRLVLSDLTVLRVNPLGLETRLRFGLQKRLYASEKKALENNFGFGGAFVKLNPVSVHTGLGAEIQPMSMFNLRAYAEVQRYLGVIGYLQSFPSANANYSDARLDEIADSAQSTNVFHASIQPMLQARVGPIAIRALLQLDYWDLALRSGDTAAYEATFDTLLPDSGWTISTDTDLLYVGRPGLAVGLRHSYVRPFYRSEHFIDATDEAAYDGDNAHQRLGLFGAYTLRDRGPSTFNKPTIIVILSWYLSHRYRTGEPDQIPLIGTPDDYTSRAVPYFLAGFAFESDFLPARF